MNQKGIYYNNILLTKKAKMKQNGFFEILLLVLVGIGACVSFLYRDKVLKKDK